MIFALSILYYTYFDKVNNYLISLGKDKLSNDAIIDHPDVIKKRLEVYYDETEPLLSFYRQKDISFYEIDASKTLEEVTEDIRKVISH